MKHVSKEPAWVGMDVDAELARYAEEDRFRAEQEAQSQLASKWPLRVGDPHAVGLRPGNWDSPPYLLAV